MSPSELQPWLGRELTAGGLADEVARELAALLIADDVADPSLTVTEVVCVARTVRELPEGSAWWRSSEWPDQAAAAEFLEGRIDIALELLAERVAEAPPRRRRPAGGLRGRASAQALRDRRGATLDR